MQPRIQSSPPAGMTDGVTVAVTVAVTNADTVGVTDAETVGVTVDVPARPRAEHTDTRPGNVARTGSAQPPARGGPPTRLRRRPAPSPDTAHPPPTPP